MYSGFPAAPDRSVPPTDTPNLTAFFTELRAGLGTSKLISIATPPAFWFLRSFQMDKITPTLDMINMMNYDYRQ